MSDVTPKIGLYQLIALQGDAYVLYNESLYRTELFAAGVVKSRGVSAPPSVVVDGEAYIVPSGATGLWANRQNRIQLGLNNAWLDIAPFNRCGFWVEDEDSPIRYLASGWFEDSGGGGVAPVGVAYLNQVNTFTKTQTVTPVALTDAPIIDVDGALSNTFTVTLGGNRMLGNLTNLQDGAIYNFHVTQAETGGPFTLSWDTAFKGTIPALTTTAEKTDWYAFQCIGADLRFAGKVGPF